MSPKTRIIPCLEVKDGGPRGARRGKVARTHEPEIGAARSMS